MIAVCIASGPSLTRADCDYARLADLVIGVNDSYRIADLDILYASDGAWWKHHWEAVKDLPCEKITGEQSDQFDGPVRIPAKAGNNLCDRELNFGGNSGFAALHLALLRGASKVLLLGYDMQMSDKRHWFGDHPDPLNRKSDYGQMLRTFHGAVKPPTPIINCSRATALTCFPRMTIQEAL